MQVSTFLLLLLHVCVETKRKKKPGSQIVTHLQEGNFSLPGIQLQVSEFMDFTLPPGQFQVFYAILGKQDALDLHRIHCVIKDVGRLRKEGLHFLQITASNGRGSASFSLPESTNSGTPLFEGARLLPPLEVEDFEDDQSHFLSATVLSRAMTDVSFQIRIWNYDRSQYYVEVPTKHGSLKVQKNQRAGYVRPLSYQLTNAGRELVRIQFESDDDLCARLVVARKGVNPYMRKIERQTDGVEKLHDMEFSRRLDLVLPRDRAPRVVLMFIFVYSDDKSCDPAAISRNPNQVKRLNISWSAEVATSFMMPTSMLFLLYLLPIVCALVYVGIVDVRKRPLPPPLVDIHLEGGNHERMDSISGALRGVESVRGETGGAACIPLDNVDSSDANAEIFSCSRSGMVEKAVDTRYEDDEWSWTSAQFALVLLPVLSLVIAMPSYASNWADDSCFHNYACMQPFWIFTSFNHIFTNVGYVLSSAIFMTFAKLRKTKSTPGHGAYNNYGLEICMGLSLLCESFASTIYHICPNSITYNLDTPFIEALCVLVAVKLYGNRRCTISAREANMAVVLVIFLDSFITMAAQKPITRPFVTVLFPVAVLAGMRKILSRNPWQRYLRSGIGGRFPLSASVASLLLNILLAMVFVSVARSVQPNQMVTVICLINAVLYFLYYVIMKRICGERWCKFSRMCAASALLLWCTALYFFLTEETDWALTPAQSRTRNRPCVLLSFFDHHDLWHLSSSLASLLSLMAVSTMDDAISALPRDTVAVF